MGLKSRVSVVTFHRFRNTDPPHLVQVWNESFTGRGAVTIRNSSLLEQVVFCKPYFDPAGLIVAEEDGRCVGFAHAGFGAQADGAGLAAGAGVICVLGVRPEFRRRGIGTELLRLSEAYLRERGARTIYAGPHPGQNPFYLGLYGGSYAPGFLQSDPLAAPFFLDHGYRPSGEYLALQRKVAEPLAGADPRFAALRDQYDVHAGSPRSMGWWQECVFNLIEPLDFFLEDKQTHQSVAGARVWEMEGFGWRWGAAAVGIAQLRVEEDVRGRGLGKYLLGLVLRTLQEQFFDVVEIQVEKSNAAGLALCRSFGFAPVDTGQVFQKEG